MGVGHPLRGDDAAGIELARSLKKRGKELVIEAGASPENYLGIAVSSQPEAILIADAAQLNKSPGAWALLKRHEISSGAVSTHDTSLDTLMEFLEKESGAEVYLLGIQSQSRQWEEGLSAEVEETLAQLENLLVQILPDHP